ncbi:Piso0_003300 [Millerozyma farinosa CBS 7064]|uniref:Piso0_003300 protein n=1 Tax=Pichia sorbitophila (strain ATCC MYA-4447 / BCRC 22081 / CBS 7064 / NBRC 10061 / NRRL Y-12695) TaxID=559304 RepID=G8YIQ3_PICSO|nr:Piso0_003300 [Millerozyma farinosa CBS 7064]CCE80963.1 Piso0_003300 [Millerozyma farinosa CBS 7064]
MDLSREVNSSLFHLLVMELVPSTIRMDDMLKQRQEREFEPTRIDTQLSSSKKDLPGSIQALEADVTDDVLIRIESYGYTLGLKLAEVLAFQKQTKLLDVLDVMKFVCREVWFCLYGKQMDNLRTNHRGTFVLIDGNYKLIENMTSSKGTPDTLKKSQYYLWFPCGIIRGVLMSFGVEALVHAELSQLPSVTFNIQTTINN